MAVDRETVDLSAYPDLVVIYLGMRVRRPRGMLRLFRTGSQIEKSWKHSQMVSCCTRTSPGR
jgi:hypothetical protein